MAWIQHRTQAIAGDYPKTDLLRHGHFMVPATDIAGTWRRFKFTVNVTIDIADMFSGIFEEVEHHGFEGSFKKVTDSPERCETCLKFKAGRTILTVFNKVKILSGIDHSPL